MLTRVLTVGLLAGLVAGFAIAVLQHVVTTPLILAAEAYEEAGKKVKETAVSDNSLVLTHNHQAAPDVEGWKPEDGLQRISFTALTTIVAAIGFAFVLLAAMIAAGDPIDERRAVAWASAAFVAAGLAPAVGLAPELPGSAAAPVLDRQIWWLGTAFATAAALWLFLRSGRLWMGLLGAVLLIAPHVVGAPHPPSLESAVPAELAARFAAASLAVQAALWVLTGAAVGLFWTRSDGGHRQTASL
ncbi:MAG: CbtA family protein [Hyphomicrobiaceae bacterium]